MPATETERSGVEVAARLKSRKRCVLSRVQHGSKAEGMRWMIGRMPATETERSGVEVAARLKSRKRCVLSRVQHGNPVPHKIHRLLL